METDVRSRSKRCKTVMIKKYGNYFWVLPLLFSIWELYQMLYTIKGDIFDFILMVGMTYWFWGMSIGKFKIE